MTGTDRIDTIFTNPENQQVSIGQQLKAVTGFQAGEGNEEQRARTEGRIAAKLRNGKKLTAKEMAFLRQYNPALYRKALMIQKQREALENRLRSCRSKEEAEQMISSEMSHLSKSDPEYEMKANMIMDVAKEFRKTAQYKQLPQTEEEAMEKGRKGGVRGKKAEGGDAEGIVSHVVRLGEYQESYCEMPSVAEIFEGWDSRG